MGQPRPLFAYFRTYKLKNELMLCLGFEPWAADVRRRQIH